LDIFRERHTASVMKSFIIRNIEIFFNNTYTELSKMNLIKAFINLKGV